METTAKKSLTIVNFTIPKSQFVWSDGKRALIEISTAIKGFYIPTNFVRKSAEEGQGVIGIAKEWNYYMTGSASEITGEDLIKLLEDNFTVAPALDPFELATA